MGLLDGLTAISAAADAASFLNAIRFIVPEDDFIECSHASSVEIDQESSRRLTCIITARRIVIADVRGDRPLHSLSYLEITAPPKLGWQRRALARLFNEDERIAAGKVARRVEIATTGGNLVFFTDNVFARAIRKAVRQAHAAEDGKAFPSRRQRKRAERMLPFIDLPPESWMEITESLRRQLPGDSE